MIINYNQPQFAMHRFSHNNPPNIPSFEMPMPGMETLLVYLCADLANEITTTANNNQARMAAFNMCAANNWRNNYFEYLTRLAVVMVMETREAQSRNFASVNTTEIASQACTLFLCVVVREVDTLRSVMAVDQLGIIDSNAQTLHYYHQEMKRLFQSPNQPRQTTRQVNTELSAVKGIGAGILGDNFGVGPGVPSTSTGSGEFHEQLKHLESYISQAEQQKVAAAKEVHIALKKPSAPTLVLDNQVNRGYFEYPMEPCHHNDRFKEDVQALISATFSWVKEEPKEGEVIEQPEPPEVDIASSVLDAEEVDFRDLRKLVQPHEFLAAPWICSEGRNGSFQQYATGIHLLQQHDQYVQRHLVLNLRRVLFQDSQHGQFGALMSRCSSMVDVGTRLETIITSLAALIRQQPDAPIRDTIQQWRQVEQVITADINRFLKYNLGYDKPMRSFCTDLTDTAIALYRSLSADEGKKAVAMLDKFNALYFKANFNSINIDCSEMDEQSFAAVAEKLLGQDEVFDKFSFKYPTSVTLLNYAAAELGVPLDTPEELLVTAASARIYMELLISSQAQLDQAFYLGDMELLFYRNILVFGDGVVYEAFFRPLELNFLLKRLQ